MKHYFSFIFILAVLTTQGQDTTKHSSKSSISFTAGTNIVYPTNTPPINSASLGPNAIWDGPLWNYTITPVISVNPCLSLEYTYLLHQYTHFSFALHTGFSYLQYIYKMNVTGTYNNFPVDDGGTFQAQTQANVYELNVGISANYRITNKVSWHNEIALMDGLYSKSFPTFTTNGPNDQRPFYIITDYINFSSSYTYLFYQTGFDVRLSNKISIMPEVSIPLANVAFLGEMNGGPSISLPTFPTPFAPIYRSLRTGITLTYNFNKK